MQERSGSPEFDREVDRRLLAKAQKGDVVITSYTLPWLAKEGVKIWLTGTKKSRAERMAKRDSTSPAESMKVIEERDRENYALYMKLYGIRWGKDLSPFTMVVGTDGVPAEKVASWILEHLPHPAKAPKASAGKKRSRRKVGGRSPAV
jgi:cytidylate kinase